MLLVSTIGVVEDPTRYIFEQSACTCWRVMLFHSSYTHGPAHKQLYVA